MAVPCSPIGDKQVQLRRGPTAENNAFTGADGELSFDTDQNRLRVHDGVTPGGFPIAGTSITNVFTANQSINGNILLNTDGTAAFAFSGGQFQFAIGADGTTTIGEGETVVRPGAIDFDAPGGGRIWSFDTDISDFSWKINVDGSAEFARGELLISVAGLITFPDNVRQIFNPGATVAGINVGALAGDPSAPINGDIWYDSTANELTARINGVNVALGAGGGGSPPFSDSTAIIMGSATPSKLLRFEVDGFTAATTRVLTPQDASYIIAGTNIPNSFTVQQAFDGDAGISIGTMLLTDPGSGGTLVLTNGGLRLTVAQALSFEAGSNQRAGNAVLVAGTVTVNNTSVTANTVVLLTRKTSGGTPGTLITYTVSAATSFTINSDSALDTSTFSYFLIEVP